MEPAALEIAKAISSLGDNILKLKPGFSWLNLITALGILFGIFKIIKELRYQKKLLIESQNQKERENISHKLNCFFSPLKTLGTESTILYKKLAKKEKDIFLEETNGKKRWRALRHLAQGKTLASQDQAILKQILDIINKQLMLIEKEGYLIENTQLSLLLGRFGAHIRLLTIAAEHKLDDRWKDLEDVVFPKELNAAIEAEIRKLQDKYKELHPSYKAKVPDKPNKIIKYYDQNAQYYFNKTAYKAYNDLKPLYSLFLEHVHFGDFILDAGCGIGRDTRYFIEQGRIVISFDASIQMVKMCMQHPFAYCLHKSFAEIDYIEEFKGVWACASLIHLSKIEFIDALYRLSKSLKPNGVLFFSLKIKNSSTLKQNEPKIYFHNEDVIKKVMIDELNFEKIKSAEIERTNNSEFKPYFFKKVDVREEPPEKY